jgi:RHS repeat-associated protein
MFCRNIRTTMQPNNHSKPRIMKAKALISQIVLTVMIGLSINIKSQAQGDNKVTTYTAKIPISTSLETYHTTNNDPDEVNVDIQYYDGLGRPVESIMGRASKDKMDVISVTTYDDFGRPYREYLPYEANTSSGAYKAISTAISEQSTFYNTHKSEATYTYTEKLLEGSPLSRVLSQGSPGNAWRIGGGHTVDMMYETNLVSDKVYIFNVVGNQVEPASASYYPAGELYKNTTSDENGNKSIQYTDKTGKVILKKSQIGVSSYASTYYLYDDFDNLRYVIQPEGAEELADDYSLINQDSFQQKWVFCYQYDWRKRMIAKRVPGSDWVYMIYDDQDRLVMTQDGNQRSFETISSSVAIDEYESKDYHIASGSLTLTDGFTYSATATRSFTASAIGTPEERWLVTKYDALNRPVVTGIYHTNTSIATLRTQAASPATLSYTDTGALEGYTDSGFPSLNQSDLLTVTYYDDYAHTDDSHWSLGSYTSQEGRNGLVTGTKTLVMGDNTFLESVTLYDDRSRTVQTITDHHLDGTDDITTQYVNVVNANVKQTIRTHQSPGVNKQIKTEYTYDHRDRVKTVKETIDGQESTITNTYNDLSELASKNLSGAQTVNYSYNIRGWLTMVNNHTSLGVDKFGMELQYDEAGQYNGNIGKMLWKHQGQDVLSYSYSYDKLNRLTNASFSNSPTSPSIYGYDYSVSGISYDLNGNILSLVRGGLMIYGDIDDLNYSYEGNQLMSVTDTGSIFGQEDGNFEDGNTVGDDYSYDPNGNMTRDLNKAISNITYNHLNLPEAVTTDQGTIYYTYDAAGMKLRTIETNGKIKDYIGGIHYEQEPSGTKDLEFVQTSEGRYIFGTGYRYNLTDHLGNVRVTVDAAGNVVQRDDYYPFGLTFNSYTSGTENLYKYNGKEEQKEWSVYDYAARFYDPALGRWGVVDPLASEFYAYSPYNYVGNNPVRRVDPTGESGWDVVKGFAVAAVDNATGGLVNLRGSVSYDDASDFNRGQDFGDVASILGGIAMTEGGGGAAAGGALVLAGSGGTTAPVSGSVAAAGLAIAAEGVVMTSSGVVNFASQKGRVNAEGEAEPHGNSKSSQKEQHGYEIKNNTTGETTEYGISGQKLNKDGTSPRVNQKLRTKYNNDPNFSGEVIEPSMQNRQDALNWEQTKVDNFTNQTGQPPVNQKRPLPNN